MPEPLSAKNAIVVGAGIAGIAASIRLAVQGWKVDVFESNAYAGGKLTAFWQDGYRFDAGPSMFTMPELVDELFRLAGRNPRQHFNYQPLGEACRYFYPDGAKLTAWSDPERFDREAALAIGSEKGVIQRHLKRSAKIFNLTKGIFLERSLHKMGSYVHKDVWRALTQVGTLDLLPSMHQANSKRLKHPKLVQLFDRYATYNGSSPYRAPAVLNLIPHLEHGIGAAIPDGGMHSISQSLFQLATELGVKFHFQVPVDRILTENGRATGIQTGDTVHRAALVVCNMDVQSAYKTILKELPAPKRQLAQERSSSGLIFYWGMGAAFPELGLHNILFSADYQGEFEEIFTEKRIPTDPTIYINITSKAVTGDAPSGKENWFVMINVPPDTGQDWEALRQAARARILAKISKVLDRDIEKLIETEACLDPRLIESRTRSAGGALYGSSSNSRMSAFFRHANFSSKVKGLYFCGGSVHPGGGIPLCLLSAKIVSDLVKEDLA